MTGSQAGSVHHQRQGTGLATVIQTGDANQAYQRAWLLEEQRAGQREQERKAVRASALAALKAAQPDYWWKHQAEIGEEWDAVSNMGAQLIANGVENPITDMSGKTLEFRKRLANLQAMGKHSKQLEGAWTKMKQDVDGKDADYFDADSLGGAVGFYDLPLSEITKKGLLPPTLTKRRPFMDARAFWGQRMDELNKAANGNEVAPEDVRKFVIDTFASPASQEELLRTYSAQIEQLTPEARARMEQVERETGMPIAYQLAERDANAYRKQRAPLNVAEELASAGERVTAGLDVKRRETPGASKKWTDPKDLDAGLTAQAEALFDNDARWQSAIEKKLPQGKEEKDSEYRQRAIEELKKEISPFVKTVFESEVKDTRGTGAERDASYTNFVRDINSQNTAVAERAAGYLYNLSFGNNLDITKAQIVSRDEEAAAGGFTFDPEFNTRVLKLTLTTDLSDRAVKEEVEQFYEKNGKKMPLPSKEEVKIVERQGERIMYVPLGSSRSDALLQLAHDAQYKKTGSVYSSEPHKRRADTIDTSTPPSSQPTKFYK